MLSFTLLGQVILSQDGASLDSFRSQKEAALLIYLAQTGQTHQRDFLAELLWENRSTTQALTNLRTVLARLRKQVGDALSVTRQSVALAPQQVQQVDSVLLLQTLADIGQINTAEKAAALQKALDSYCGDFLANFHLPDAPQFNEWAMMTRNHIQRQVISAYNKLAQYTLTTNDIDDSIAVAHRWLQADTVDETAHTFLLQRLLDAGRVREAVAHYEYCVELLRTELGIEPPAKMTALIRDIQPQPAITARPTAAGRHNLPVSYNQFFGRTHTQQEIHLRLDQSWCHLVTITGQGGVGKTRLATVIAHSRRAQHPDGVWLVE
ncbi:MAG: hypothetical protein KC413_23630, partial [Anaerolineales bacterium]|nr:hypothetical protein [Anaerolineales bacterium]